jgi:hypothetical protein
MEKLKEVLKQRSTEFASDVRVFGEMQIFGTQGTFVLPCYDEGEVR